MPNPAAVLMTCADLYTGSRNPEVDDAVVTLAATVINQPTRTPANRAEMHQLLSRLALGTPLDEDL